MPKNKPPVNEIKPSIGERTHSQNKEQNTAISGLFGDAIAHGFSQPPHASIKTYDRMRRHPVTSIGMMALTAPIKAANWSLETDKNAPPDAADVIEKALFSQRPLIVGDSMRALIYGHQSFELVWMVDDGKIVPKKFKQLRHSATKILYQQKTGAYAGLENDETVLPPPNTFLYSYQPENGDLRGIALFENIREHAWWPWMETMRKTGTYINKVAGAVLVIRYPDSHGYDSAGAETDNVQLAKRAGEAFGKAQYIIWPQVLLPWADEMMRKGAEPSKLQAWAVEFIESNASHGDEMLNMLKHWESLILRGLMVPERAVTEGQYGTKAESEVQAGLVLTFADQILNDFMRNLNWHVTDRILAYNYGEKARGTVRVIGEPLIDETKTFMRDMIKSTLGNSASAGMYMALTDIHAQLDRLGMPRSKTADRVPMPGPDGDLSVTSDDDDGDEGDEGDEAVMAAFQSVYNDSLNRMRTRNNGRH